MERDECCRPLIMEEHLDLVVRGAAALNISLHEYISLALKSGSMVVKSQQSGAEANAGVQGTGAETIISPVVQ